MIKCPKCASELKESFIFECSNLGKGCDYNLMTKNNLEMNKETIKFLWEIYNELVEKDAEESSEYGIDPSSVILKIKERIDLELQ